MKRYLGFCAVVLCGALVSGALSGCSATEKTSSTTVVRSGDGRPAEVQVKPRGRAKLTATALGITIAKVAPSPTPSAKGKKSLAKAPRSRMKDVPVGTNVPFYFSLEDGFWPLGLESLTGSAKCYEVTNINPGSSTPITVSTTQLGVFANSATSLPVTLTPGGTTQVTVNVPSTLAGKTLILTLLVMGEDASEQEYTFKGADIFVVNP